MSTRSDDNNESPPLSVSSSKPQPLPAPRRHRSMGSMSNVSASSVSSLFKKAVYPGHYRRAKIVRKAAKVVDKYVTNLQAKAPYLQQQRRQQQQEGSGEGPITEDNQEIPLLERSEITVGKMIGEGGFCQVWEVGGIQLNPMHRASLSETQQRAREVLTMQPSPDKKYVLKQLKKRLTRHPPEFTLAAADLVMEAQYLSNLSHRHILPVRGMTLHGTEAMVSGRYDSYFLLLDRLEDTLDKRIQNWVQGTTSVTYNTRLKYCYQIALALQHLHARRIIFRDCKPLNIGFTADDTLQLFDLGLCRELPLQRTRKASRSNDDGNDGTGGDNDDEDEYYRMTLVGTRRYMAIEMFISGRYNCKADVYSWAMTCYELLSLSKPFAALSDTQHQEFVCMQGNRPGIKPLLQQCEAPPGKQPPVLKVLRAAWEQYVGKRIDSDTVVEKMEEVLHEQKYGYVIRKQERIKITGIFATEVEPYSSPSNSDEEDEDNNRDDDDEDSESIQSLLVDKVLYMPPTAGNSRNSTTSAASAEEQSSFTASSQFEGSGTSVGEPMGSSCSGASLSTVYFEELLKDRRNSSSDNNDDQMTAATAELSGSLAVGSSASALGASSLLGSTAMSSRSFLGSSTAMSSGSLLGSSAVMSSASFLGSMTGSALFQGAGPPASPQPPATSKPSLPNPTQLKRIASMDLGRNNQQRFERQEN